MTWESLQPATAFVSPDGAVTGVSAGEAAVRATFVEPDWGFDLTICPLRTYTGTGVVRVRPRAS